MLSWELEGREYGMNIDVPFAFKIIRSITIS
jgi:hypothetical protein